MHLAGTPPFETPPCVQHHLRGEHFCVWNRKSSSFVSTFVRAAMNPTSLSLSLSFTVDGSSSNHNPLFYLFHHNAAKCRRWPSQNSLPTSLTCCAVVVSLKNIVPTRIRSPCQVRVLAHSLISQLTSPRECRSLWLAASYCVRTLVTFAVCSLALHLTRPTTPRTPMVRSCDERLKFDCTGSSASCFPQHQIESSTTPKGAYLACKERRFITSFD